MFRRSLLATLLILLAASSAVSGEPWSITIADIAKQKTEISNKLGYPVRIHLFAQGDMVRGAVVKNGNRVIAQNKSWLVDSSGTAYRINVFKSQVLDELVAKDLWVVGDTTLKLEKGKVVASTSAATTILNNSKETVKVCIYNEKDKLSVVPKAIYTIDAGKKVTYAKPDTKSFKLAVFRPAFLDEPLVSKIANDRALITITPGSQLIWAFGDSLTAGIEEGGGRDDSYPAQLQGLLVNHTVVNKGSVGEVVSEEAAKYFKMEQWGKRRLGRDLDKLAKEKLPDIILLCQGANDRLAVMADNITKERSQEIEESLKSDLEAMIKDAKDRGIQVVLISQVNEFKFNKDGAPVATGVPGFPPAYYGEIARKVGIPVDNETLGALYRSPSRGEYLTEDNRHFSKKGGGFVAQKIMEFLVGKDVLEK